MEPPQSTPKLTLAALREIAPTRALRRIEHVAQPDGGFFCYVDTGARRVVLVAAHGRQPRRFASVDGIIALALELGITRVDVDLAHYRPPRWRRRPGER